MRLRTDGAQKSCSIKSPKKIFLKKSPVTSQKETDMTETRHTDEIVFTHDVVRFLN